MKRIRLLYLTGYLGFGGSERQLFLLIRNLDPQLFDIHILVLNESPTPTYSEALAKLCVSIRTIPSTCKGIRCRSLYIYRLLRSLSPDIIHSWTTYANAYAGIIGHLAGIPVRWGSLRNSLSAQGIADLPRLYRWLCFQAVSKIIVNAKALKEELLVDRFPEARILVLPNCIELMPENNCSPDPSIPGVDPKNRLVGLVGNIRPQKNPLLFVEAMAKVLPAHDDVQAVIVGEPLPQDQDLPRKLETAVQLANLTGRLLLTGFRQDIPAIMNRLTVFCLASDYEGMPNVVQQAMAAGCPVVATNVGGVSELIEDGINGFLIAPGDAVGMAQAVSRLLSDPDLANTLGQRGRQTIEQGFSCRQTAERLTDFYITANDRA